LSGQTIEDVKVACWTIIASDHGSFIAQLVGQKVQQVVRLGKWIKFDFVSGTCLLVHLKMTGQFITGPWPEGDSHNWPPHARVAFLFSAQKEAVFFKDIRKFARLRVFDSQAASEFIGSLALGPDPFEVGYADFYKRLTNKKGRLKQVLLNQSVVAGLGNISTDESLFAASILPSRPSSELTRAESDRLLDEIKRILTEAIKFRGSTVDNYQGLEGPGSYQQKHQVYRKSAGLCPRCRTSLSRSLISGRTTVFCPNCQK
jgi:formamidopyrimidine-DNA glycosylase